MQAGFVAGDRVRIVATGALEVVDGDYGPKFHPRYSTVSRNMYDADQMVRVGHHPPLDGRVSEGTGAERLRIADRELDAFLLENDGWSAVRAWDTDGPHRLIRALDSTGGMRLQFSVCFTPGTADMVLSDAGDPWPCA
jgi:hypothetical protein